MKIAIKRIYDAPSAEDGQRISVDRIWPRGVTKAAATLTLWLKEIAPSTELRKWFHADTTRWEAFRVRYRTELDSNADAVAHLRTLAEAGPVTLLYSVRDPVRNHAAILVEYLGETLKG